MHFFRFQPFLLSISPRQLPFPGAHSANAYKGLLLLLGPTNPPTRYRPRPVNQEGRLIERFEFHLDISEQLTDSGQYACFYQD